MSAQVRAPPRAPPGEPPKRRGSRNAISNPKYRSGSGRGTESDRSTLTPINEVFPPKRKVSRNFIKGRNRNTRNGSIKPVEGDVDVDTKGSQKNPTYRAPTPPREPHPKLRAPVASFDKIRGSMQKGSKQFARALFGDSDDDDSSFDPDDVEDIDYEKRVKDIEDLPFYEKLWAKKIPGRLGIALTAVTLIWLTSLGLIRIIVARLIFPSPSFSELADDASAYFGVLEQEKDGYVSCADFEFQQCQDDFTGEVNREVDRTNTILQNQEVFLDEFEVARATSKLRLNDTLNDFIDLVGDGQQLILFTVNGVDFDDCPRVRDFVVTSLASTTALSRQLNVDELTNQALEEIGENFRIQQEFSDNFWANKDAELAALNAELANLYNTRAPQINADLDVSFDNFASCFQTDSCGGEEGLQAILDRFNETLSDDTDDKNSTFFDADSSTETFINAYNVLLGLAEDFNENVFPLDLPNTPPVSVQNGVDFDNFFEDDAASEALDQALDGVFDDVDNAIENVKTNTINAGADFANEAGGFDQNSIEPYNPPTLDPTAKDQYEAEQAQRNQDLANSLTGVQEGQSNDDEFFEPTPKQSDPTEFVDNVVSSFPDRELDFFSYPDDVFRNIEVGIENVLSVAIALDVLIRIAMTFLTFNKYWKLSKIGKPPGDVRVKELIGKHFGTKKSPQQKLFDKLTHPAVLNGLTLIFTVAIVSLIYSLYSPFYDAFIEGCKDNGLDEIRDNTSGVEGTMLYNNLVAASISFAAQSGDATVTTAVDTLNNDREIECERNTIRTVDQTENQFELFAAIKSDFQNTLDFRDEILTCIDLQQFDQARGTNTQVDLADASFSFEFPDELESGIFDCGALSLCNIAEICTFSDNDVEKVEDEAFILACDGEQFIHSTMFSFLLIMLIYVTMFIFRKNFMRALVRLFWREINPYDFNILATCLRDGTHVDPEPVTESGFTFQDTATLELHKAIRKWEKESWMFLAAAIALHFPWLFGAIFLREGFH